ncbi:3-isopropylmalate dehydratase large subunit [ANME-1 cluster archaeon AG-394-G21]|nr:3-isopropylmalate dehydratase large subunit [ANME-1 cluster archaeon AG-394-G21]NAT10743.1 3-isopropylmalate dehydratase large subunit [ANME-1 cluster archaeon AG-394-G06]
MATIAEKILKGEAGEIVEREVDYIMVNDITGVPAFEVLDELAYDIKNEKAVVVQDHYVPNKDVDSAEQAKALRNYARKYKIANYYEIGKGGICHQVMIEAGYVAPGRLIIGADSHTCSYGALGAFSTGVGSTEAAAAMATGRLWFKVPETQKFVIRGEPKRYVMGKDIILHIIGDIGVSGSLYKSQEFYGTAIESLNLSDRITISNMAIEAGAKAGIIPPDEKVFEFLNGRVRGDYKSVYADGKESEYEAVFEYDASEIVPTVAKPFSPANTAPASELDVPIDQAYLGSCTNGRIEDLRVAAAILSGKKISPDVRMIVVPASQAVLAQAIEEGVIQIFLAADAFVSGPTCGACLGGHMGVLAKDERCISTTNRNFIGRMGHKDSEVYLANPAVVAASAITGRITDPTELE